MASFRLVAFGMAAAIGALGAAVAAGCSDDEIGARAPIDAGYEASPLVDAPADAPVVARGERVLGLSIPIGDQAFGANLQVLADAGARTTNVALAWDDVEQPFDAGVDEDAGDAAPTTQIFNASLHVANLALSEYKTQAVIAAAAVDGSGSRAPAELAARPLDDVELGARYDKLTDYVLNGAPDLTIAALLVGTEVDVPLGSDAAKHAAFATFVGRAAAHAHEVRPGVKVGFTVTAEGIATKGAQLAAAWAASDVIGVSYLPVDAAAHVRSPTEVDADLDRILAAAPAGKPVFLHEAGFPTAAATGGDEAAQAAFVSAVFAAWDRHGDRIPVVTFRELDDAPEETARALAARAKRTDPPFLAFVGSLGLRTADGRKKQAWNALFREARARGF